MKLAELQKVHTTPEGFWRPVPTVVLTILVYIVSQLIAGVLLLLLPGLFGVSTDSIQNFLEESFGQFLFIFLVESIVIGSLWGLLRAKKFSFKSIGVRSPKLSDLGNALIGFGIYFVLYLLVASLARAFVPGIDFEQEQQIGFETARTTIELALVFVSLVVLPPVTEEILARGFLYTGLKTKLPLWGAAFITSVMFAAAHLQFGSDAPLLWVAAIDTFTLSLVLIYLREKTGGLMAPIFLHMIKNGLAFTLLFVVNIG